MPEPVPLDPAPAEGHVVRAHAGVAREVDALSEGGTRITQIQEGTYRRAFKSRTMTCSEGTDATHGGIALCFQYVKARKGDLAA